MRKYNYLDIININQNGILFFDNNCIDFEECRHEWAQECNISIGETVCVATRFCEKKEYYFIFYSKERVKVFFEIKGVIKKRKAEKNFHKMQVLLNRYGYTSYDMS